MDIPREFYPWIRGANNEKCMVYLYISMIGNSTIFWTIVENLMHRTGTKVNIPPSHSNNETIIITGERDGVDAATAEIKNIYQQKVK